jgi:hypothetical protein
MTRSVARALGGKVGGIFQRHQPEYARHGIATFPVGEEKLPAIRGWQKVGLRASTQLAQKFHDANAFAFLCGERNGLTVLDVDTTDERVLADALVRHGQSPIVVRTGSGKFHAYYRHNGEPRKIRPWPELPIDQLGGGIALAPPSTVAKGAYQFIRGGLEDLGHLKPMVGAILARAKRRDQTSPLAGMREHDGRNAALFNALGPIAREIHQASGDHSDLLDAARRINAQCAEPMEDTEVTEIVDCVWNMQREGRNYIGIKEAFCLTKDHVDNIADPYAFKLLAFLRLHQGPAARFWCTNGLAKDFGWDRKRMASARSTLIEMGYLKPVRQAGRGNPAMYKWGSY